MSHSDFLKLKDQEYKVVIKSSLKKGKMNYAELYLPGKLSKKEILLTTYFCHPSMANDNLSGIVLLTCLANWLSKRTRNYSYRILFIPETIGSIYYISKNIKYLKNNLLAGYVLTCLGDKGNFSFLPSRKGNTVADDFALRALKSSKKIFTHYSFLDRGSDERQFCSVGVDLPVCSVMKSKYAEYKEYHTSLDNMEFISQKSLQSSLKLYKKIITDFEKSKFYKVTNYCEPHLSKYNLYPTLSTKYSGATVRKMMNILAYADGTRDIISLSELTKIPMKETLKFLKKLEDNDLVGKL